MPGLGCGKWWWGFEIIPCSEGCSAAYSVTGIFQITRSRICDLNNFSPLYKERFGEIECQSVSPLFWSSSLAIPDFLLSHPQRHEPFVKFSLPQNLKHKIVTVLLAAPAELICCAYPNMWDPSYHKLERLVWKMSLRGKKDKQSDSNPQACL